MCFDIVINFALNTHQMPTFSTPEKSHRGKPDSGQAGVFQRLLSYEIKLGGNGNINKKKQEFYGELGTLLEAGVEVKSALELIEAGLKKGKFHDITCRIRENLINGKSLAGAFETERIFSNYETVSLRIGEESGRLDRVVAELGSYFQKKIEQKKKIAGAFTYPAIVVLVALAAVFFMMRYVVPMFEDVFKRFNNELPAITQKVIGISHWIGSNFMFIVLFIAAVVIFVIRFREKPWFRTTWHSLLRRVPFFGEMARKMYMARFCSSMELLISSQAPLVQSLELVRQMIQYYPLELALSQISKDVVSGVPLHECMTRFPIFDRKMLSMVRVGEEVNQLAPMFAKLRQMYDSDTEHNTAMMGTIMEPLIIIFVGLIVGVVLISMYLPMFKMNGSIGPGM